MTWIKEGDIKIDCLTMHGTNTKGICTYRSKIKESIIKKIILLRYIDSSYQINLYINKSNPKQKMKQTFQEIKKIYDAYDPDQYDGFELKDQKLAEFTLSNGIVATAKLLALIFKLTGIDKNHQQDLCSILGVAMEAVYPDEAINDLIEKLKSKAITTEKAIEIALTLRAVPS